MSEQEPGIWDQLSHLTFEKRDPQGLEIIVGADRFEQIKQLVEADKKQTVMGIHILEVPGLASDEMFAIDCRGEIFRFNNLRPKP